MASTPPTFTRTAAVLLAAGRSTRMGAGDEPRKPFLSLAGRTVLEHTCAAFDRCASIQAIVLVGHEQDVARLRELVERSDATAKVSAVVPGGKERTDSVRRGVMVVPDDCPLVAIHDAARPFVLPETIERAILTAAATGSALVAIPCADTVKTSSDGRTVDSTLDRSVLWLAQTPQVFETEQYRELLLRASAEDFTPTDDAALFEKYVGPVTLVRGRPDNVKLTTPEDLELARALLSLRADAEVREG